MKIITIKVHGHEILINQDGKAGAVSSDLKEACPYCDELGCYNQCDESQAGGFDDEDMETEDELDTRRRWNYAIDGIESMVLAHLLEGIDVNADAYRKGIEITIETLSNKLH